MAVFAIATVSGRPTGMLELTRHRCGEINRPPAGTLRHGACRTPAMVESSRPRLQRAVSPGSGAGRRRATASIGADVVTRRPCTCASGRRHPRSPFEWTTATGRCAPKRTVTSGGGAGRRGQPYGFLLGDDADAIPTPPALAAVEVLRPSEVIDPGSYAWRDGAGRIHGDPILYELHVGTFTPEGTCAAEAHLEIRALGVTVGQ